MIIEICTNSFASAKAAQEAGADRVELCTELSVGGLTPSYGLIQKVRNELSIPIHVMIRPRSGNFTYSADEVDVMIQDILFCKEMACAGIVSGALTIEKEIDIDTTQQLIQAAEGMEFTFHRAFDWCQNPQATIEQLIGLGAMRVLSSGQSSKAIEGIDLLKNMKSWANNRIQIMPGSGINPQNVMAFKEQGFEMIHFSATQKIQTLNNVPKVSMHSASFFEEGIVATSQKEIIQEIKAILQ